MKTVIILSGGMDSTVLLHQLIADGDEVFALGINYGQRHGVELAYAKATCERLGVPWQVAELAGLKHLLAGSSQTSDDVAVPDGHYAEESMKLTVVPNRNMVMLAVAAGYAMSLQAGRVAYAAHGGDHAIYPDCRPEFADAVDAALALADWHPVSLHRPFVNLSKADLAFLGTTLGVDFAKTWSCYKGGAVHCGTCGTCTERREAFELAGVRDPTEYLGAAPAQS